MRFFGYLLLAAVVVIFANPFLPYWGVMGLLFLISAIIKPGNSAAFWGGGFGMALSWVGLSLFLTIQSGSDLPDKVALIMGVGSSTVLLTVTGIIGFLLGSFSSLCGNLFRKMIQSRPKDIYRGSP